MHGAAQIELRGGRALSLRQLRARYRREAATIATPTRHWIRHASQRSADRVSSVKLQPVKLPGVARIKPRVFGVSALVGGKLAEHMRCDVTAIVYGAIYVYED